jgi:hypothetical protein
MAQFGLLIMQGLLWTLPVSFAGSDARDRADLSWMFPREVIRQTGQTCHIYSALGAMDAACSRAAGQPVLFSRAYQIMSHIKDKLRDRKPKDWTYSAFFSLAPWSESEITGLDQGWARNTLKRVISEGARVSDRQLGMDVQKVLQPLKAWAKKWGGPERERLQEINESFKLALLSDEDAECATSQALRETYQRGTEELDQLMKDLLRPGSEPSALESADADPAIRACFERHRFEVRHGEFSIHKMKELLSKGIPMICEGLFFLNGDDDEPGMHSTLVVGYRPNREFPDGIEYKVRDSYLGTQNWGWTLDCSGGITWLKVRKKARSTAR